MGSTEMGRSAERSAFRKCLNRPLSPPWARSGHDLVWPKPACLLLRKNLRKLPLDPHCTETVTGPLEVEMRSSMTDPPGQRFTTLREGVSSRVFAKPPIRVAAAD